MKNQSIYSIETVKAVLSVPCKKSEKYPIGFMPINKKVTAILINEGSFKLFFDVNGKILENVWNYERDGQLSIFGLNIK